MNEIQCEGCHEVATKQIGFMALCDKCAQLPLSTLQVWDQASEQSNSGHIPDFGLPRFDLQLRQAASVLGALGGKSTSPAKQAASRTNGRKGGRPLKRGSRSYWQRAAQYGVPHADRESITCQGDSGYGPCGIYTQWASGKCSRGHKIEFKD